MSQKLLRLELFQKMSELATAGLGLVAALAWNDAIQTLFKTIFGDQSAIWAKFMYALLVTILVVVITFKLSNVINKLKQPDDGTKNQ